MRPKCLQFLRVSYDFSGGIPPPDFVGWRL
uniref:Uncharacterized protein n=1 Tax=mine drainage metagenome TaxID=410659 RepID=E6PH83_9ZZZZ